MTTIHLFPPGELESHAGISLLTSLPDGMNKVGKSVHGIQNSSRLNGFSFCVLLKRKVSFKMGYYK